MTVSDVFTTSCRGTVFDVPCPASFVGVNQVVGNLVVEQDPVLGGGSFSVKGGAISSKPFEMVIDETKLSMTSANEVVLRAGNVSSVNTAGGSISLEAGEGQSVNRGSGGTSSFA